MLIVGKIESLGKASEAGLREALAAGAHVGCAAKASAAAQAAAAALPAATSGLFY